MKRFKRIYLRDKVFFKKEGNSYRKLGNAITIAKQLSKYYDGLYVYDLNMEKNKNFVNIDIYDVLSSFIYVQVDVGRNPLKEEAKKLYRLDVRMTLYCGCDEEVINKKYSALYITKENILCKELKKFKDVVTKEKEIIEKLISMKKRIFFIGKEIDERVFCTIY